MIKHEFENSRIFNGDCMAGMAATSDDFYELAVVDPPYGIGRNHNKFGLHKKKTSYKNSSIPGKSYFDELFRVSKHQIIWGCQYMIEHMNPEGSFIVWNKHADPDLHNMSSCDIAWFSKRERIRMFDGHWCGAVKIDNEKTIHPHQKPIALYDWIFNHYANPGDKILDTHLGSGSSRIAAYKHGLDFTGYELDEEYFDTSIKRFIEALNNKRPVEQVNLFQGEIFKKAVNL